MMNLNILNVNMLLEELSTSFKKETHINQFKFYNNKHMNCYYMLLIIWQKIKNGFVLRGI